MVITDFKKVIASVTTILFISTSIQFTSDLYAQPVPAMSVPALDITKITVNGSVASLEERHQGTEGPGGRIVIAVQDAHGIFDAQMNIRRVIEELQNQHNFDVVGLEGGTGKTDYTLYRAFPDEKIKEEQAMRYLKRAELSGGEAAAILNPKPGIFYGIEDKELYYENRNSFLKALEAKDANLHAINLAEKKLDKIRSDIFPEDLKNFHMAAQQFTRGRVNLLEFAQILKAESGVAADTSKYPNIVRLFEAIARARQAGKKAAAEKEVEALTAKIEGRVLFEEINAMTEFVVATLVAKEAADKSATTNLIAQYDELNILRNLVSLEMTRKEYDKFLTQDSRHSSAGGQAALEPPPRTRPRVLPRRREARRSALQKPHRRDEKGKS